MKTRSLCAGVVRAFLISATAAILVACAPPLDSRGEGNLRIVLAGETSSGARAISPETEADLSYKLYFSGPRGETANRDLEPGIKNITLTLSLGNWTIRAEAYLGEVFYGSGETTVTVEAGRTNDATIPMKTAAKEIIAFSFATPAATGIVDTDTKTIAVTVPYGTDVTDLVPTIVVSEGATISRTSDGPAGDFTEPVTYTVTAADGSTALWIVTVTVVSGTAKEITAFSFVSPVATGIVDTNTKTIAVTVPYGTDVTDLVPTIVVSEGATISRTSDGPAGDFTEPVTYTVTAADGSIETWTVTVTGLVSLNTIALVQDYLDSAAGGGVALNPVSLPVTLNLADSGGNGWAELLGAIDTAGKHVALDLSACTMSGTEFDPGTANTGESRIVSLVLPALAESIKTGTAAAATFQNFTGLTSVTGVSIKTIGNYAFHGCAGLSNVNYPAVENIGVGAFAVCTGLTSANLSTGLTYLGQQAFLDCAGLTSITLPASLVNIGPNPFAGCINLTDITIAPGNPYYKVENGKLLTIADTTLVGYPTATGTITLPGITTVGPFAFQDCVGLVSVDLPNATNIGDYAFDGCVALISVDLPNATSIGNYAFSATGTTALTVTLGSTAPMLGHSMFSNVNTPKTVTVKVPAGATGYGSSPADTTTANWGNGFRGGGWNGTAMTDRPVNGNINLILESASPAALTTVAAVATYLASATGGASAADLVPLPVTLNLADSGGNGWAALLGAINTAAKHVALDLSACTMTGTEFDPGAANTGESRIVSLVLPNTALSIRAGTSATSAFQHFTSLARITGNNLTDVGDYAFYYRATLESVDIPSVTVVDRYAFAGCTALTTVNFPVVQNIEAFAFSGCGDLILASLPNSLTNIGQQAFENCYDLTLTSLPSNLTFLGDAAFRRCNLSSISIPASLGSLGANPFGGCSILTTITVESGNLNYKHSSDNRMLLSKDGKTLISYPSAAGAVSLPGIETLGLSAFIFCANLTSVDLPDVASIRASAFVSTGTTALTVTLGATVPELGEGIFVSVDSPKTVTVKVPVGASAWTDIGVDDGATTSNWWGNGFRGGGWDGANMTNSSNVNANIALTVEPDYLSAIADVTAYLASAPGGASLTDDPVPFGVDLDLTVNWTNLLSAINNAHKYVALDLSACDISISGMTGAPGEFDPGTTSAGKDLIVSLVLPDNAASIKSGAAANNAAFRYFDNLESVAGEGITAIGDYAFYNCAGLKWMGSEFPEALSIGAYAFYGCTGLLSVEFGAVTNIGNDAFSGCANLSRADFPEATGIGNYAFSNCAQLSWTDFSEVVTIGNYAFYNCAGLEVVSFPEATDILDSAFSRCTSLERIYLPNAESIGVGVFRDTGGQALEITLGDTAPTLGTGMFTDVSSKDIFVNISTVATTSYGSTSYDDTNISANTWGNGFRGGGWNGTAITGATDVNPNISLTFYVTTY